MKWLFILALAAIITTGYSQKDQSGTFKLDEDYKMSPTGTIKLSSSDAKVKIIGSNRATAHVKVDREVTTRGVTFGSEEFTVEVEERNGNLEIRERSASTHVGIIGYHYERYNIDIEAPIGVSLIIQGDDGDFIIRNINGEISMDVDDGDIELYSCKGNAFSFRLDDGDLAMDEGAGKLDIDADDADIRIARGKFSRILADLDDGDLIIETSLDDRGEYSIRTQDGLVDLVVLGGGGIFDIRHDDGRVTTEGEFDMIEKSEDYSKIRLAKGSARIDIRADDGRVRLASK